MPRTTYLRIPTSDPSDNDDDFDGIDSPQNQLTLSILPSPKRHHNLVPLSPVAEDAGSPIDRGRLIRLVGLPEAQSSSAGQPGRSPIPTPSRKKADGDDLESPQHTAPSTSSSNGYTAIPLIPTGDSKERGGSSPLSPLAVTTIDVMNGPNQTFSGSYDEQGRPIVDVLDSMNEDPFTLETFETMIRLHANRGKDFVIARVTTVDPNDETRFYYSYYAAHHINKVLFRTQPEEGLLHRMKARNPLNNMLIIGDVHYYAIRALAVNLSRACGSTATRRKSTDSLSTFLSTISNTIKTAGENLLSAARAAPSKTQHEDDEEWCESPTATSPLFGYAEESRRRGVTSPTGSFDDRMGSAVAARFARKMRRLMRVVGLAREGETEVSGRKVLHLVMRPEALVEDGTFIVRRGSADDAYFDRPNPEATVNAAKKAREILTPQIASAISQQAGMVGSNGTALSAYRKVRSISFLNDASRKASMSLEEWMRDHSFATSPTSPFRINTFPQQDSPSLASTSKAIQNPLQQQGDHPLANLGDVEIAAVEQRGIASSAIVAAKAHIKHLQIPTLSSGKRKDKRAAQSKLTANITANNLATSPSPTTRPKLYYTAEFIGTDDDFLMKASTRAFFKESALETQDAVLFTIPGSSGEMVVDGEQHPALLNFVFAVREREGQEGDDIWRNAGNRAIRVLVLAYSLLGFLLVKFVDCYLFLGTS
ncbi:hypothetical protein HDU67_003544 [Dinochytrium kinnereticum]|nr:hypothetical protein HDU67_003544 [Dinochytrium kinnereticum]